jgi:SAM-dependent methyltransferase
MDSFANYMQGELLYGDDFNIRQVEDWFMDEKEGYANLGAADAESYRYKYHALNVYTAFQHIAGRQFRQALGLGSAYGDEFMPIASNVSRITVLDPSDAFEGLDSIHGTPCSYLKPESDGRIPFADGAVDLITCFAVLHHIPNVSAVLKECRRCLSPQGCMVVREPIVSMGDWTKPRPGLTKRERGIPRNLFKKILTDAGFRISRETYCDFSPLSAIARHFRRDLYNSPQWTFFDALLSRMFKWNVSYHRQSFLSRFAPASVCYVLE